MNTRKKFNIPDYLKGKNVKRFGLFVSIAFVFLIFSKLSNDYKQTVSLKINLVNFPDEMILNKDSTPALEAFIEAKGFALLPFIFKGSNTIVLDAKTDVISKPNALLFDVQRHIFLIEGQLGSSYKVISVMPDTIVLPYSTRASKFVPIELKREISYAVGYDIKDDFNFNVDSVKVVGSEEELNKVDRLKTELLKLNDVKADINQRIAIDTAGYQNIDIFPKQVTVRGEIARFTEGTIEVAIRITNKPSDVAINYFPKVVQLVYYVDLDNYNSMKASDFSVECNYADLQDEQSYLVPKIVNKPDFVKRANLKQKRIDFIKL